MKSVCKFVALALMLLVVMLSGCAVNLPTQEKNIDITMIVKRSDFNFWEVVKMGAEAAGKEFSINVDFKGPTDENDIDGQIRMVEEAIAAKTDALVLAASDYLRLVDVAEKAVSEDIPVIIIDSEIKSDKMMSFIGTDNVDAGMKLGETLIQRVGSDCNVAVMSFVKGAATCEQREEGFLKAVEKYPGIKVITTVYCNSDESMAETLTEDVVKEYPDLDAVVCLNAYGAVGTARTIKRLNLTDKIKIIGFDSTPEEISFLEKDVIQALVVQNPFKMGYFGIKYALDVINNKEIPERVNTGSTVIDKSNMYLPENQKLVFPFTN